MSVSTADSPPGEVAEKKKRSKPVDFIIRLVKEKPLGTVGAVITLTLLFTGLFADFLAPYGMNDTHKRFFLAPPSAQFLLGTDQMGRDILSRIIYGARVSVIVGMTSSAITTFIAVFVGTLSGYIGGKLDLIVQRFVDAVMCLPGLVLLMVIISMIGPGMWSVIITLGVLGGISSSRVIRSAVIGIKENVYVSASVAIGCKTNRVLIQHILPNIMAPIIILFSLRLPAVILSEASLSFLGFGIPPPAPSWGGMLGGKARPYMMSAPWMVMWPGLALAIVVFGANIFGDALRDLLDPRLRGGIGRYGVRIRDKARLQNDPDAAAKTVKPSAQKQVPRANSEALGKKQTE